MPEIKIENQGAYEIEHGTRLVNAIEGCGVDIGHRCGGNAKCTTCRVRFIEGEPTTMTRTEFEKVKMAGLPEGVRLACQIRVEQDLHVEVLMRTSEMGWDDPGPTPDTDVQPEAVWLSKRALADSNS